MKEISGKTAFITGGGAGIGLALAKVFARAGMRVVIADLRQDHLDDAMVELRKQGAQAHAIRLDVSDRAAFAAAADEAERVFGTVHVLCNNAGVNIIRPITEATFDDVDWVVNVNLIGMFNGLLTFIPRIIARGEGGHIVNTSSVAGVITGPGTSIYSATKFAIRGLSDALRYDLAPHRIGVTVLVPGTTSTKLHESEDNRQARYMGTVNDTIRQQRAGTGDLFRRVLPLGMDPMAIAERALQGIRENRFYVLSHSESEIDFREVFDDLLAGQPDTPPDPERLKLEAERRQRKHDLLKLLRDL
jgi:NAD(P)-dependent dehydrogenase (short-subunit alcohol dehydrogenase family)